LRNLLCFIIKKKSSEIEIEQINIVAPYHTSQQLRFGLKIYHNTIGFKRAMLTKMKDRMATREEVSE
jgi:hypothetical protein